MKFFIKCLRETAEVYKPFSDVANFTGDAGSSLFDPYALVRLVKFNTIAEMFEAQEAPVSKGQFDYLDNLIFSGMGSLQDFSFDTGEDKEYLKKKNEELDDKISELYEEFKKLEVK